MKSSCFTHHSNASQHSITARTRCGQTEGRTDKPSFKHKCAKMFVSRVDGCMADEWAKGKINRVAQDVYRHCGLRVPMDFPDKRRKVCPIRRDLNTRLGLRRGRRKDVREISRPNGIIRWNNPAAHSLSGSNALWKGPNYRRSCKGKNMKPIYFMFANDCVHLNLLFLA